MALPPYGSDVAAPNSHLPQVSHTRVPVVDQAVIDEAVAGFCAVMSHLLVLARAAGQPVPSVAHEARWWAYQLANELAFDAKSARHGWRPDR